MVSTFQGLIYAKKGQSKSLRIFNKQIDQPHECSFTLVVYHEVRWTPWGHDNWSKIQNRSCLQVEFDDSKVDAFLKECSHQFEEILDAEDASNGPAIEAVLSTMQSCSTAPIVSHLVTELFHNKKQQQAA